MSSATAPPHSFPPYGLPVPAVAGSATHTHPAAQNDTFRSALVSHISRRYISSRADASFPDQLCGRVMPLHRRSRLRFARRAKDVASPRRSSSMWNRRLSADFGSAVPRPWPRWAVVLVARLAQCGSWSGDHGRGYAGLASRDDYSPMHCRDRWGGLVVEESCEVIIDHPIQRKGTRFVMAMYAHSALRR